MLGGASGNTLYFGTSDLSAVTDGIAVAAGSTLSLSEQQHGALPHGPIYVHTNGNAQIISVMESVR